MQMRQNADGSLVLALGPESGAGIDLALNNGLLHSLAELINNAANLAQWDLSALIDGPSVSLPPENATVN
jgi:hypothetical protein